MIRYECPVCWQSVKPTKRGNIGAHNTVVRARCPGSGLVWTLTRFVEHGIARDFIA